MHTHTFYRTLNGTLTFQVSCNSVVPICLCKCLMIVSEAAVYSSVAFFRGGFANMEAGLYKENDELLECIAQAAVAGTRQG
jgi:hypothetical protein